eukprot:999642-Rhodomonas_salina.1
MKPEICFWVAGERGGGHCQCSPGLPPEHSSWKLETWALSGSLISSRFTQPPVYYGCRQYHR